MKSNSPQIVEKYPFFRMNDLAIPLFLVIAFLFMNSSDKAANISDCHLEVHAGVQMLRYRLEIDSTFTVMGNLGEMEISIENERARIASSPCQGQDCVNQGWLSGPGDMAVCVPSGVFIIVSGNDGSHSPDAVSY